MPRAYKNSLFYCFKPLDLRSFACCLPCVLSGQNHHRIEYGYDKDYHACNSWCVSWCLLMSCGNWGWVLQMIDRNTMRRKYDLQGSTPGAFCASLCCQCCELIQTEKELKHIHSSQSSAGYQAPARMAAQPNCN
ncbi:PLAC8 family-domain-containing protein [Leptodontidium sp. 2 PMI_412]|nr:PLAC8 family-domain-containing protein [Leptodontidium sp. 2 PMI_412]